ncbi:MAG: hypothetical protein WDM94_07250 [Bauldia sp.]
MTNALRPKREKPERESYQSIAGRVQTLAVGDNTNEILTAIAEARLSKTERSRLVKLIAKATGDGVQALKGDLKDILEEISDDSTAAINAATAAAAAAGFQVVRLDTDHNDIKATTWKHAIELSRNGGFLYVAGMNLVRLKVDRETERLKIVTMTPGRFAAALEERVKFLDVRGEYVRGVEAPRAVTTSMLDGTYPTELATLSGVVRAPFYVRVDSRAKLVSEKGYHAASGFYYDAGNLTLPLAAPVADMESGQ